MAEALQQHRQAEGCAYIIEAGDGGDGVGRCGEKRRPGSSYCALHHARCHLPGGSQAETRRLLRLEGLALAVGGRSGRAEGAPSAGFLTRAERLARLFS